MSDAATTTAAAPADAPSTSPVHDETGERVWRCPESFRYWEAREEPRWQRLERLAARLGHELFPTDEQARMVCDDLFSGDPVAERFVAEVFFGEIGHQRGRQLLDQALRDGIESVPDAPESMRELFADFDTVPDWVDREQVELGAAIWRRWGTMLFSVAGSITLEVYTEAGVATPLSLAGGYAGDNALRRFLETAKFWIDVSEPGALFTPGSQGRTTAMQVRVMHVSVRKRVGEHEEWDHDKWGLPISQTWAMLTQVGGSVAPGARAVAARLPDHPARDAGAAALQQVHGPPARRAAAVDPRDRPRVPAAAGDVDRRPLVRLGRARHRADRVVPPGLRAARAPEGSRQAARPLQLRHLLRLQRAVDGPDDPGEVRHAPRPAVGAALPAALAAGHRDGAGAPAARASRGCTTA